MNEETEKIYNKLLVLFTSILILFVSFVCFIFIGIAKVDAQSITTSDYHIAGINTSWGVDGNEYHTNSYDREYGLMGFQFIPYDNSQYFQLTKTSYSISYTASVKVNPDYVLKGSFTMLVNNNGTFQNATCDYNEQYDIEVVSSSNNTATYNISYSCGELISNGTYNGIMFRFITTNQQPVFYRIRLNDVIITDLKDIGAGDSAIIQNNNQNTDKITQNQDKNTQDIIDSITEGSDKTNESLDNIEDSLLDSDTSSSSDSLDSFFGSFNNSDNGGLSAIITAPLVAINKTLDNTCPSLDGSYKGQSFSVPSGCVFWNRIPQVKEVANIISGGFLCYLILRKMFLLIHQLKDPTDDRVEVMNL